jgi:NSS family neurotransmitter:Na+ symporter
MESRPREAWGSRLGFILAASGSAIGLGNIVFFSARSYTYGGGAFYLPYLVALLVVGLPMLLLELAMGRVLGGALPSALGRVAGRRGEFVGWWGIANALIITMYYITLLAWITGMGWRALMGSLWETSVPVVRFGMPEGALPNPVASFFDVISSQGMFASVALVWGLNVLLVLRGTRSIERAVKIMMPLLWIMMAALLVTGLTLPGGLDGVWLLLTPDLRALGAPTVWQGAFSQIFFTLSLGFGIMTAYGSYLPARSDDVANACAIAGLNCLFELLAGLAVFTLVAVFALTPKASTLAMMFFIVPAGIAQLPLPAQFTGTLFFSLLLMAGLTSSVSLVEAAIAAIRDRRPGWSRSRVLAAVAVFGLLGSCAFAAPMVLDPGLEQNGTLGLTLLDFIDHYTNSYGLILVGFLQALMTGWLLPPGMLRSRINEHAALRLGPWFDVLVRWVIPGVLGAVLLANLTEELARGSLYGQHPALTGWLAWLPLLALAFWGTFPVAAAWVLSRRSGVEEAP